MTARTDLTDAQWKCLQPLLPPPKVRGRPRNDDRHTLNGILFLLRTGAPWRDLPRRYGPSSVVRTLPAKGGATRWGTVANAE
ncbi:MAG: transposase [Deinococcus sp.]|nr:transposase [Deinococcus sp.]